MKKFLTMVALGALAAVSANAAPIPAIDTTVISESAPVIFTFMGAVVGYKVLMSLIKRAG
jgi:hypothetical protein